ncbi:MAG: hypothetical protein RLZZ15_294 [Verrucomicrobiota bacterium]|jgi:hypothetical protein
MNPSSRLRLVLLAAALPLSVSRAQISDSALGAVAGIPVNYTEAKTGAYTLPDPLTFADGSPVADARAWREKRRPELLELVEENEYGRVPPRPPALAFDVFDQGTPALDGKALRKQVTIYFTASRTAHYVDLLVYLPARATGPAPVLLNFGWTANNLAVPNDPGVKVGRTWNNQQRARVPAVPVAPADAAAKKGGPGRNLGATILQILARGYGFAIFNYNDIDPDALNATAHGIRAAYLKPGATEPAPDEWGAIAAWGWGASRMIDYFETDSTIDAKRIAITGASRLGKTVLWAAARDERIAGVIASVSGEGGAALSRRDYGETIAHLVAPTRYPYQFAGNYQKWADKTKEMPWDAHTIIALVAPRPILLQTGSTDKWSDPYGEFLAARAATPVFALLGKKGIEQFSQPALGRPLMNTLGYLMHDGPHGVLPADRPVFLDFLDAHLKPAN